MGRIRVVGRGHRNLDCFVCSEGYADVAKSGVSSVASNMGAVTDPMGYAVDSLLRNPGNPADKNGLANSPAITGDTRQEVMQILAMSVANGSLSNDDRGYLAKLVAARTGPSQRTRSESIKFRRG